MFFYTFVRLEDGSMSRNTMKSWVSDENAKSFTDILNEKMNQMTIKSDYGDNNSVNADPTPYQTQTNLHSMFENLPMMQQPQGQSFPQANPLIFYNTGQNIPTDQPNFDLSNVVQEPFINPYYESRKNDNNYNAGIDLFPS